MGKIQTNKILYVFVCILYLVSYVDDIIQYGKILTAALLIFILLTFLYEKHMKVSISISPFIVYIAIFCAYCLFTLLWAEDPSRGIGKIRRLIIIFFTMYLLFTVLKDRENIIEIMLKIIMYGNYCVILYVYLKYGFTNVLLLLSRSERIGNEYLNANTIGLCAAYSVVINSYFLIYKKSKLSLRELLLLPALFILAVSESRKAFVGSILGIFALSLLKNYNRQNFLKSLGRIIVASLALILLLYAILRLPVFSGIMNRMNSFLLQVTGSGEGDKSSRIRFLYNQLGMNLFKQSPVLGIGIGNANLYTMAYYGKDHYLHNNYVELLACGGVVGFIVFYWIYLYFFVTFLRFRNYRDPEYDMCFVMLCILLLLDYGLVSYYSQSRYFFCMLFWFESQKLKDRYCFERNQRSDPAPTKFSARQTI